MNFAFTRDLEVEICEMEKKFKQSLQPWWGNMSYLLARIQGDLSYQLMPSVALLAYKYLEMDNKTTVSMANIFKTIYFANKIHALIRDNEEGQLQNQELQFTILIGDYIFGRVLKLLLEAGADQLLDEFARMMSRINEGLVIRYKLDASSEEIIWKSITPLYATAFASAARLKGLGPELVANYEQIGLNLGMVLELTITAHNREALTYLEQTYVMISEFEAAGGEANTSLDKLLQELQSKLEVPNSAAVI